MICLHTNQKEHMACNLRIIVKSEGVLKVTGSQVCFNSGSISKTVVDRDIITTGH